MYVCMYLSQFRYPALAHTMTLALYTMTLGLYTMTLALCTLTFVLCE